MLQSNGFIYIDLGVYLLKVSSTSDYRHVVSNYKIINE
jgi:hypothetical protein